MSQGCVGRLRRGLAVGAVLLAALVNLVGWRVQAGLSPAHRWLPDDWDVIRTWPTPTFLPRPKETQTSQALPRTRWAPPPYRLLDRFGVAFNPNYGPLEAYPLSQLPFGWYADWGYRERPQLAQRYTFAQTIRVGPEYYPPDWEGLRRALKANPGALWIIGNEPECIYQDRRTPEEYAEIYHTLYTFIKQEDPTAQVAIGGVVEPTPLRLMWLDRVLAHYQQAFGHPMPVDVWNIHVQILREKRGDYGADIPVGIEADEGRLYPWWENDSVEHFRTLVWEFRQWMAERGQRDKPLIITEFGVLMPNTHFDALGEAGSGERRVRAFMTAAFDFLLTARDPQIGYPDDGNRLVQRWLWFSLNHPSWEQLPGGVAGFNGGLCDPFTHALTPYGQHYARYMRRLLGGNQ